MTYYLQSDFGNNVSWECVYHANNNKKDLTANSSLSFSLIKREGTEDVFDPIPDLLIWKEPCRIPDLIDQNTPFILGSDELIDQLIQHNPTDFVRHNIDFDNFGDLLEKTYSILVFRQQLSEITFFPETGIQISSLSDPTNGETIKGFCSDMTDFRNKMNTLIATEMKMIKFKEFAIFGSNQIYGFGRNSVVISDGAKESFSTHTFYGLKIVLNKDFNVINLSQGPIV